MHSNLEKLLTLANYRDAHFAIEHSMSKIKLKKIVFLKDLFSLMASLMHLVLIKLNDFYEFFINLIRLNSNKFEFCAHIAQIYLDTAVDTKFGSWQKMTPEIFTNWVIAIIKIKMK